MGRSRAGARTRVGRGRQVGRGQGRRAGRSGGDVRTRVGRQARVLWRFRYHLLSAGVALAFWDSAFLKPFRVFVVLVHEVCHATAALATGGQVLEMRTAWEESGHTLSQGGWPAVIVSAGYLGSAVVGAALIAAGVVPRLQRLLVLVVGATAMGMTMAFTPAGGLDFYLGIFGGLVLVCLAVYSAGSASAAGVWLGVMLCLYSLEDFRTDLWCCADDTDAGVLAAYVGVPWLAYPIAGLWVWLSLSIMARALAVLARHEPHTT